MPTRLVGKLLLASSACSLARNKPYATRLQTVSELLGLHAQHWFVNHVRCIILGSNNYSR